VTVEVTPEESEKLALGSQVGSLSLALRNAGNMKQTAVPRIRVRDLGPEEAKEPVAASSPSPRKAVYRAQMPSMAVTRGTETTIMEVAPEGGSGGFVAKNDGAAPATKARAKHPSAAGAKPPSSGAGEAGAKPAPEAGS
jgi:pilus assembly protein CpaB